MMSVLVENPEGRAILLTKGAPEEIFVQCSQFELDGKLSAMDPQLMVGLKAQYESLSNDGFRVLAVATKELPGKQICSKEDERGLVLKGYVAFLDPPKETAARALEALRQHGVAVKILTGDNQLISRKVCKDVGLLPDPMLLGGDVEKMSDVRIGGRRGEGDAFRSPLAGSQGAGHPCAAGQGARGRVHGRRDQRRASVAGRRRRHFSGHGHGHRQGIRGL